MSGARVRAPFLQEATSGGGLDLITRTLVAHVASEGVVADGMALLKTLGHSDVNKRLYCDPTVGTYALMLQVRRTWVVSLVCPILWPLYDLHTCAGCVWAQNRVGGRQR